MSTNRLELAKEYALTKGGKCLSHEYINNTNKLEWKCQIINHRSWLASYSNIISNGRWCPECGKEKSNNATNIKKLSKNLIKAKEYAISKGGKCLTNIRINGLDKLEWKCNNTKHNSWFALYNNVVNINTWCPECDKEKRFLTNGLEIAKTHALSKNGKCLSSEYHNSLKMEWRCHNPKHTSWFALYNQVINMGSWCPECDYDKRKLFNGLEKAQQYALSKNGQCLSTQYINTTNPMEWKCHNPEHNLWFSNYNNIVNNKTWCDKCGHKSGGEKIKIINGLEKAQQYATSRNGQCLSTQYINTNTPMEWKCHNPYHKPWKTTYCHAIYHNSWCPECSITKRTKIVKFNNGLSNAKKYAESKGGLCLSNKCNNQGSILEWKCHNSEHKSWDATYHRNVNNKYWCPECKKEDKEKENKLLLYAQILATSKGGECLSSKFMKKNERLEWKCHNPSHPSWFSVYSNVVDKKCWCKHCNAELRFPKENYLHIAKKHAIEKNGQCLSNTYINQKFKMEWKCSNHEHPTWLACYTNVIDRNSWCPQCRVENLIQTTQEFRVQQILNYLFKTSFIKNRSLSWNINPKTNHKLELDGYSKDLKLAFEFQGRQHFEDNIFKGLNLLELQSRDKWKKENCINNGVTLIVIEELLVKKNCINFFASIIKGINNAGVEVPYYDYQEIERIYKLNPKTKDNKINYKKQKIITKHLKTITSN